MLAILHDYKEVDLYLVHWWTEIKLAALVMIHTVQHLMKQQAEFELEFHSVAYL